LQLTTITISALLLNGTTAPPLPPAPSLPPAALASLALLARPLGASSAPPHCSADVASCLLIARVVEAGGGARGSAQVPLLRALSPRSSSRHTAQQTATINA
jgi:hypothetical protein